MPRVRAAIFDLDHTIVPVSSWTELTSTLGASVREHLRLYTALKTGRISYRESKRRLLAMWHATGSATMPRINEIFSSLPLAPGSEATIQKLRDEGIDVVFITGSMNMFCQNIADRLGVRRWYANTELVFDDDGNLTDMNYRKLQAATKLRQLRQYCDETSTHPNEVVVIGDGPNDVEMFRYTGTGILVLGPHSPAAAIRAARWVVDRVSDVLPIILGTRNVQLPVR